MAQDDGKEVQTIRGLCILVKLIASGLSHGLKLLLSCRQLPCQPWLGAAVLPGVFAAWLRVCLCCGGFSILLWGVGWKAAAGRA